MYGLHPVGLVFRLPITAAEFYDKRGLYFSVAGHCSSAKLTPGFKVCTNCKRACKYLS
jgi:hypothetical protein